MTSPPIVGRADELAELRRDLKAAERGMGRCAMLEGPAGIGKSSLLMTIAREARELGMAVGTAKATELDRVAPLSTFLSVLQTCDPPVLNSGDLADLATHSGANRFWIVDRIGELLEEYLARRPLLLSLDDLQWADEFTVLVLRILVPRLSSSALLWLLARRLVSGRTGSDTLDGLLRDHGRRLELGPLSASAVQEMCEHLLGAQPGPTVLALAEQGGGNPFLLEELLTRSKGNGRIVVSDGFATAMPGDLPADFITAVNRRLGGMSVDARRLLDAGAVLGRPFTVHEAAGLIGKAPADLASTAEEVVDLDILVGSDVELTFRHELIREAVYYRLPLPVRQALHREAAEVLRAEGRPAVEIATHLARSARKGDQRAVAVLREAAHDVGATAPSTAADLMLRTLELVDSDQAIRHTLTADAVRLLASAGRVDDAIELGEEALGGSGGGTYPRNPVDPEAASEILLGLAEALKHAGKHDMVVEYTGRALGRSDVAQRNRADLLAVRAHALLHTGDIEGADEAGASAVETGEACGADAAVVFGAVARSVALRSFGKLDDAVAIAKEAVDRVDVTGGEARHRHPGLWLGRALVTVDRFADAENIYKAGRQAAEDLGSAWSLPLWHFYLADMERDAGRLDDAAAEAEAGLRVAEELSALATSPSLLAVLADIAIRRDDLAAAQRYLDHAERLVIGDLGLAAQDLEWGLAKLSEARGEPKAALDVLASTLSSLPTRALLLAQMPSAGPDMVRMACAAGDRAAAEVAAAATARLAKQNPNIASIAGAAAHAMGLLRRSLPDLRLAAQAYRFSPRSLAAASVFEDCARAEHSVGHQTQAVDLLDEALRTYNDAGAVRDAARARRRLRQLGVRRKSTRETGSTTAGWSSLTESELRVARLVAEGMTNRMVAQRLFLSPHTVDSHLRHSFTKLGVTSRVELTREVLAHDGAAGAVDRENT